VTRHVVVGGCGFIGRHLARALALGGDEVSVVDTLPFPGEPSPVKTVLRDVLRMSDNGFDEIVRGADVVHHYAWTTIPASAEADPAADLRDNLGITIGLLEALRRRGGGRMVFASSGGTVYGRLGAAPAREDDRLAPITAYGVSKVAAEKYMQSYRDLHGVDARVLRISNPYGAGQDPLRGQGAVTTFVHRALDGRAIEIWGDGEVVRDFIHICDLIPALVAAAGPLGGPGEPTPVFNLGSGAGHSLNQIVGVIEQVLGARVAVERKATRPFDVPVSVLDTAKAARELGWRPRIDLQAGIARMIDDLRADRTRLFSS
jgi:UDP-glucose 4-epimerase